MNNICKQCPTCMGSGTVPSGRQVKALLDAHGIKQGAAAAVLGISRAHLSGILNGHREFTPGLTRRLREYLGAVLEH